MQEIDTVRKEPWQQRPLVFLLTTQTSQQGVIGKHISMLQRKRPDPADLTAPLFTDINFQRINTINMLKHAASFN